MNHLKKILTAVILTQAIIFTGMLNISAKAGFAETKGMPGEKASKPKSAVLASGPSLEAANNLSNEKIIKAFLAEKSYTARAVYFEKNAIYMDNVFFDKPTMTHEYPIEDYTAYLAKNFKEYYFASNYDYLPIFVSDKYPDIIMAEMCAKGTMANGEAYSFNVMMQFLLKKDKIVKMRVADEDSNVNTEISLARAGSFNYKSRYAHAECERAVNLSTIDIFFRMIDANRQIQRLSVFTKDGTWCFNDEKSNWAYLKSGFVIWGFYKNTEKAGHIPDGLINAIKSGEKTWASKDVLAAIAEVEARLEAPDRLFYCPENPSVYLADCQVWGYAVMDDIIPQSGGMYQKFIMHNGLIRDFREISGLAGSSLCNYYIDEEPPVRR